MPHKPQRLESLTLNIPSPYLVPSTTPETHILGLNPETHKTMSPYAP